MESRTGNARGREGGEAKTMGKINYPLPFKVRACTKSPARSRIDSTAKCRLAIVPLPQGIEFVAPRCVDAIKIFRPVKCD